MKRDSDTPVILALLFVTGLFITAMMGGCGDNVQQLLLGIIVDTRDWNRHVHVHHH
jgi:hypothetical protein